MILVKVIIINLTILECKYDVRRDGGFEMKIINLTILECKYLFASFVWAVPPYNKSNHIGM